jgi:tRNA (uracil-5-)-methyltransferase
VQNSSIKIIGRSRGQRVVMDSDFVTIKSEIDDKVYKMRQVEGAFSQPNLGVNAKMLNWARANLANIGGDMLELYCGSGNFTIVNSELFEKVLATEVASSLIDIAKINAEQNNITNLSFVRLSAAETAEAMSGVREFNRLRGIDLNSYNCSTIFVDPPRAGLDEHSLKLAQDFDNICYISCSPTSLHRDMMELVKTHTPVSFAMFDQFAYTNHIECGVTFKKNKVR